ncbi:hypothetical protein BGZ70_007609 [Mortierella alpina]|uniref:Pentatricopeptide repeat protein n=1 Tax=Mortierella alpina TaxID=64518 RepID=A0A9P6J5N5_MORAP|nr:hypothetical protein BGZ70_007609 [Mortierella alpina]
MSLYICRRCALAITLRRARFAPSFPKAAPSATSSQLLQARSLSSSTPKWSLPAQAPPAPSTTRQPSRNSTSRSPADTLASTPASKSGSKPSDDNLRIPTAGATTASHILRAQRRIDHLVKRLDVNALYLEFWKICSTETIDDQKLIWSTASHDRDWHHTRQESIYRVFNSPSTPRQVAFPLLDHVHQEDDNATRKPILSTISIHRRCDGDDDDNDVVKDAAPGSTGSTAYTMKFVTRSHAKRLLQIHLYFQDTLELPIGYFSRIALLVAFASRGDMITVHQLFRGWQRDRLFTGGKEMYSAVIRGLVGTNFQDSDRLPFHVAKDHRTGIRNHGTTQMYAALDLFYELLRQGGTPTFETYHSLILGLSTFKNDMEAAELLLDHMIIKKKKPYVQVLHVMCREYARRRDFPAAERIFGMLKEYGIRPRALTCNIMLRAVFQMSTLEALQHLGHITPSSASDQDLETTALQLKRQKIQEIREYMQENDAIPDEVTFSTLVYGFGHMKDGYADLEDTMQEMSRLQPPMEPTLIILNSLLFANLNHGHVKKAEAILDRMLATQPLGPTPPPQPRQQLPSPFQNKQYQKAERQRRKQEMARKFEPTVPGKGTFHALMLALVERGDIKGMERVLDKMIHTNRQQSTGITAAKATATTTTAMIQAYLPASKVDLDADEYTANIMLLGYLSVRDFTKVDLIQKQIRARTDWRSSSLFWDRDEDRRELVEFLKQQSSRETVRRSLLEDAQQKDGDRERHESE